VPPDTPLPREEWSSGRLLRNFSVVRKLEGRPWPPGYEAAVAADNASPRGRANGGAMVLPQPNERALLGCLLAKLQAVDADVLVGHNISASDLSVLMHRLQALKAPLWSRVGRLKRGTFPKLTGGGHIFGGGASAGLLTCLAGRLLCDTYLAGACLFVCLWGVQEERRVTSCVCVQDGKQAGLRKATNQPTKPIPTQ
jgi:DNA polymerase alpha subunit A